MSKRLKFIFWILSIIYYIINEYKNYKKLYKKHIVYNTLEKIFDDVKIYDSGFSEKEIQDKASKKSSLYTKILNLYHNCKTSIENADKNVNKNNYEKNYENAYERGNKIASAEEDMINMLRYIEIKTDNIISLVNSYTKEKNKALYLIKIR